MKIILTVSFIILPLILVCSNDARNEKYKYATIEKIVKKICNITIDQVAKAPFEEKPKMLGIIEEKLNKSAVSLGFEGDKYVKFIMHGVKLIVYNNTKLAVPGTLSDHEKDKIMLKSIKQDKYEIIIDIAYKIVSLAREILKSAKTSREKWLAVKIIQKKFLDHARKKNIQSKFHKIKQYSDLIGQGLHLLIERNIEDDTRGIKIELNGKKDFNLRSIINTGNIISNKVDDESDCITITEKTCAQISTLNSMSCDFDDKVIPLEKLCNDIFDCQDNSDEQNCIEQGINGIRKTIHFMSEIESPPIHNCFARQLASSVMSRQVVDLRNILDNQLKFIEKFRNSSNFFYVTPTSKANNSLYKKSVNEISIVITTLTTSLEGALCSRRRSLNVLDQLIELTTEPEDDILDPFSKYDELWPPNCECNGMVCANISCQIPCQKICMQKNSFNTWTCGAMGGGPGVLVSVLCDGKVDCYDKTDETNCSYGAMNTRFLASSYFYDILNIVKQKSLSYEYFPIQYKRLALNSLVINLQKLSISKNIDNEVIRDTRDRCLSTLASIYEYLLFKSDSEGHLDNYFKFLNSVKDKLLRGLKLGNTGNEKLGTTDDCVCVADRCGMATCSKTCMKACPIESKMTRYYCGNTKSSTTVPIELVCDGKSDCPEAEDEDDCKQEICRKHHLLLLLQSFENTGRDMKGTAAGEALLVWESKAKLLVAATEKQKPTRQLIKNVIDEILQLLVTTYGSIDDFRRSTSKSRQILKYFIDISRKIIITVKNCK